MPGKMHLFNFGTVAFFRLFVVVGILFIFEFVPELAFRRESELI